MLYRILFVAMSLCLRKTAACCSWDNCGGCQTTSDYCQSQSNCEGSCSGKWCAGGSPSSNPATNPGTTPASNPVSPPHSGGGGDGYNTKNVCSDNASVLAYTCLDWSVGSGAMTNAANSAGMGSTHFFGIGSYGSDGSNMGKCYELSIEGVSKKALLQVINQGGDVAHNQFDLQMGDGGFGAYNGCATPTTSGGASMYNAPRSTFGAGYGGVTNRAMCSQLPDKPTALSSFPAGEHGLIKSCQIGFDMKLRLEGGGNPKILSASRVNCPSSLIALTGLKRTDDGQSESHGQGTLTRMMDCCKPSAGWVGNAPHADAAYPAVIPCHADGYTRIPTSNSGRRRRLGAALRLEDALKELEQ